MNRQSISKLESVLRDRFLKLHDEHARRLNKNQLLNSIAKEWTKFLEESGCYFYPWARLVELADHPEGFVLVADPVKTRTIAVPQEIALKAIVLGYIP